MFKLSYYVSLPDNKRDFVVKYFNKAENACSAAADVLKKGVVTSLYVERFVIKTED